ncbi:ester cyclase [Hymenobacter sp. RP-2-7]|uniref:Ester cyclase n=1 Tax=Hymenobacter polaris TaxID=2682546 RepID=A0A7Y0ABP8_9BACT|nr:ester cyclase [Hymenobacter polaris]NML64405.1 ester cyclase [Hymenobacter polaris]
MSTEANKAVVTRYWQELWNDKREEVIDEITSPDLRFHFPPGQAHQPATLHQWFTTSRRAFPNVRFTVHDLLAEGDKVVARWSYEATQTGEFLGQPATQKQVTDQGLNLFRLEDGRIVEMWMSGDSLGLLRQIGMLPA